jgi:hypothetical protein
MRVSAFFIASSSRCRARALAWSVFLVLRAASVGSIAAVSRLNQLKSSSFAARSSERCPLMNSVCCSAMQPQHSALRRRFEEVT